MNRDNADRVADDLLHPQNRGLRWNNEADRLEIITNEARDIIHLLEGINRFRPNEEEYDEADTLIISLNNALTNLNRRLDNNGRGRGRKRKRKSIKTKSRKSRKSKKSRK